MTISTEGLDRLHEAMRTRVNQGELPGLVTVVAQGDEVHVDTIGSYAFDGATPMTRDTIFRVASLTKPILAAATMRLVQQGVLDLAEPVDRWLPELANPRVLTRPDAALDETVPARRPITVDDLLTFRLGTGILTEPTFNPPFPVVAAGQDMNLVLAQPDPRTPHPPDVWIRLFGGLPLIHQPGERWMYNAGSLVLGVLVARAGAAPLGDVLAELIFDPLGMRETGFVTTPDNIHRIPTYYMTDFSTGQMTPQPLSKPEEWTVAPPFPSGSAGLLSTVDDFLAFARLLSNNGVHNGHELLSADSIAKLTTNHLTQDQIDTGGPLLEPKGWGYGMAVAATPDEISAVPGRYGWDGGYGTVWFNDPNTGLIAMAFTQTSDFLFNGSRAEFSRLAIEAAS